MTIRLGLGMAIATFSLLASAHEAAAPTMLLEQTTEGSAVVIPNEGTSGQYGSWVVTYTVGQSGIKAGGGIRVQLPDEWHSGPRNSANRLQTTDPAANNFITGLTSGDDTSIRIIVEDERDDILIKHAKVSLDGRTERYVFVVRALLENGELKEGDTISVIYGDRTGGSAGYRAAAISTTPLPVLIAIDADGSNEFKLLKDSPRITSRPGSANELWVHLPSQAVAGQTVKGLISLVDQGSNAIDHAAALQLALYNGQADFPTDLYIASGKGFVEFEVTPRQTGIFRLKVRTKDLELETISNPMRVTNTEAEQKIYWGDLHSHSHFSWDGVGYQNFDYARYVAGLDFYAMTDHSQLPQEQNLYRGLSDANWDEYTALIEQYNAPPQFVTIQAYECSFGTPYGHHNVYFRDKPGVMEYPGRTTLPELWSRPHHGDAPTIPHHTGKFPKDLDFSVQDEELRRNLEIYSGHGLSEVYDPTHPLAFEQSIFTWDSTSLQQPSYLQDVWQMGLLLSALASSDDHFSHPGQPQYGLAAVRAPEATRDAIFQGMYDRRTYATTGAKIILDFSVNEIAMGQSGKVDGQPEIRISANGTDEIDWVELLRFQPGDEGFQIIQRWEANTWDFEASYTDKDFKAGAMYYCRLRQKNNIRNRAVMAWSSPVWTQE